MNTHSNRAPLDINISSANLSHAVLSNLRVSLVLEPKARIGKMVQLPEPESQIGTLSESDLALARWRQEVTRPALILEKGSPARAELIEELAKTPRLFPNGKRKAVTKQTLFNWLKAFEAEGLNGLTRKRRKDLGAKRQKVARAWDAFFEAHIAD
jgi:hypothetical protein